MHDTDPVVATRILFVEVSFRDRIYAFQELNVGATNVALRAFTLDELIAEKLRALLQQPIRKRNRRQDVYDIALLLDANPIDDALRAKILETLIEKCRSRRIEPTRGSIDDLEVAERARRDWETLRLEVSDLPPFAERFAIIREFYHSLPW